MTAKGPASQEPPSIDASLARLQELRVRAEELIGGRPRARRGAPAATAPRPAPAQPAPSVPVLPSAPSVRLAGSVAEQVAAARDAVAALRAEVEDERATHLAELDEERARCTALEHRVRDLTGDLETVLADLDATTAELDEEREKHRRAVSELVEQLEAERADAASLSVEIDARTAAAQAAAVEAASLVEAERPAHAETERELRLAGDTRAAGLTAEIAALRAQHASDLEGQRARNDAMAQRFAREAERVAAQLEALKLLVAELGGRATAAETERDEADARVARAELDVHIRQEELDRLRAEARAQQEALVSAQRRIAEAQVGIATTRQELDRERVERGAADARLQIERTAFEDQIGMLEAQGAAALGAERILRRDLQADLQGRLAVLREELHTTTASLRGHLEEERRTLQQRVVVLEQQVGQEERGRIAAETDRDTVHRLTEELREEIDTARRAADESRLRCDDLEQELVRRDDVLRRVTAMAGDLGSRLDTVRRGVADVMSEAAAARAQAVAQAEAVARAEALLDAARERNTAQAGAQAQVQRAQDEAAQRAQEDAAAREDRKLAETGPHREHPAAYAAPVPWTATPEVIVSAGSASLDELVARIERLKEQVRGSRGDTLGPPPVS